jgi:hypothetical protein
MNGELASVDRSVNDEIREGKNAHNPEGEIRLSRGARIGARVGALSGLALVTASAAAMTHAYLTPTVSAP